MSVTLVQSNKAFASATSVAAALSGVAAGNTLIIIVAGNSGATLPSSLTDSSGNTVSTAVAYATTSSHAGVGIYYVQNASAGAHTITCNWAASNSGSIFVAEYSGLVTSTVFDLGSPVSFATSTTIATAAITPSQNGDLIILGIGQQNNVETFSSFLNGFTQEDSYNTNAPSCTWAALVQATAASVNGGATSSAANGSAASIAAFKAATGAAPTVTSVNGGAAITEGATNVAVVGTNFASGMTSAITQPGATVAQSFTFTDATDGTFNLTMEPGTGSQLAFTDATYTTTFAVTVAGNTSTGVVITLQPPSGLIFQTLASINPTSTYRITAVPDLAIGDQLEAAGNAAGTSPVPTGLTLNSDATFQFSAGNTPAAFWVRAYDGSGKIWGTWAQQSIPAPGTGNGGMLLMGVG